MMPDVFVSPGPDKLAHPWAQGEGGVWVPIEHLTEPGELIVDPFCGTATWLRIAASMGRRCIGADVVEGGAATVFADAIASGS
jgi:DNA modification methylase